MRAMGLVFVVQLPPEFYAHLRLGPAAEPFPLQQFVTLRLASTLGIST